MKKLILFLLLIFFFSCDNLFFVRHDMTPDQVFNHWLTAAKLRQYEKMFKYEYFYFDNVIYCFNRYNKNVKWNKATIKEKDKFVKLYQQVLVQLLNKKSMDSYESLLRLKTSFQIKATHYTVDLMNNTAELWIAGDYPGEERIKLIRYNHVWYLINPFGYQNFSYMPILRNLLQIKKKR